VIFATTPTYGETAVLGTKSSDRLRAAKGERGLWAVVEFEDAESHGSWPTSPDRHVSLELKSRHGHFGKTSAQRRDLSATHANPVQTRQWEIRQREFRKHRPKRMDRRALPHRGSLQ
jgi:hypothetical protein